MAAEEVNGVTGASTSAQNTDMSETPGCALLIVIGEPASPDHRELILEKITNGLKVWNPELTGVNLNNELQALTLQNPEPDETASGDLFLHRVTDSVAVDVLFNPTQEATCTHIRNFLLAPSKHRLLIYSGHALDGSGDWLLQDDLMPFDRFASISKEVDVENALKQTEGGTLNIYAFAEGHWGKDTFAKMEIGKAVDLKFNAELCEGDSAGHHMFVSYLSQYVKIKPVKELLQPSDVVGNIRFSRPTLYIFPGYQGDSALFGISGFNLLINGGYGRKACFWEFTRHLDRIDACLVTHLGADNLLGMSSVLERKAQENVHPEIGHVFMNGIAPQKHSPNGDLGAENGGVHKSANLLLNLSDEGSRLIDMLQQIGKPPHPLTGSITPNGIQPMNLYHKVGHGSLDMYVLNPIQDAKDVKDFLSQWSKHVATFSSSNSVISVGGKSLPIPLPHQVSICALLVWRPACPTDMITRILFPGSAPQNKLFDGLDKIKNLDIFQTASAKQADLNVSHGTPKKTAKAAGAGKTPSSRASPVPKGDSKKPEPKKAPAKGIQQKTNKDQLNKKTIADRKKSPSATPKSSSPKSTPATSRTASRTPSVATPEEKALTPTPSEPEVKAEPVPEKVEIAPKVAVLIPEKIEPVVVEKVEAAPEAKEPEKVEQKPEKIEAVPEPEPKPVEPAPVAVEEPPMPPAAEPEPVKEEPPEPAKEEPPEPVKEEPPELVKEDPPEPVKEELPASIIEKSAPVADLASPVSDEEIKLEISANVEATPDTIGSPASEKAADNLLLDLSSAPAVEQKSPTLESPEPLPDPAHFDSTSFDGAVPAADVQMEIPPVVDARPFDEKPAESEENQKGDKASEGAEQDLIGLGASQDDTHDLIGIQADKQIDGGISDEPHPAAVVPGEGGAANGQHLEDLGIYDDESAPPAEPPAAMTNKAMEDLGIFDGPESDSHVPEKDSAHPPAHHLDPMSQDQLFDGASPEGLPEPVEPPRSPECDIIDPREMDSAAAVEHVNKLPTPPPEDKYEPFTMQEAEVIRSSPAEDITAAEKKEAAEVVQETPSAVEADTPEKVVDLEAAESSPAEEMAVPEKMEEVVHPEKMEEVHAAPPAEEAISPEKMEEVHAALPAEEAFSAEKMEEVHAAPPAEEAISPEKMEEVHAAPPAEEAISPEKMEEVHAAPLAEEAISPEKMDDVHAAPPAEEAISPEKMDDVHAEEVIAPEKMDDVHAAPPAEEAISPEKMEEVHAEGTVSSEEMEKAEVEGFSQLEPETELHDLHKHEFDELESKPESDSFLADKIDEADAKVESLHDVSGDRLDEPETASVHDSSDDMSHEHAFIPPQEQAPAGFIETEQSRMDEPLTPERPASPEIFGAEDTHVPEMTEKLESSVPEMKEESSQKDSLPHSDEESMPKEAQPPVASGGLLDEREFHARDDEFASSDDDIISDDNDDMMEKEAKAFSLEAASHLKEQDTDEDDSAVSKSEGAGKPEEFSEKDLFGADRSSKSPCELAQERTDPEASFHSDEDLRAHSASPVTGSESQDLCPSSDLKDELNKSASPELLHPSDADHSGMDKSHSDVEDLHSEEVTAPTPASISDVPLEDDVSLSDENVMSQDNKVSEDPLSGLSAQSGFSMETSFHEQRDPLSSHSPVSDLTQEPYLKEGEPMEVEHPVLGNIAMTGAASCLQEPQDFPLSQESPLNSTQDDLSASSESHPLDSHLQDPHTFDQQHQMDRSFGSSEGHSQEGHPFDADTHEQGHDQHVPGHDDEGMFGDHRHQPQSDEFYQHQTEPGFPAQLHDDFTFGSHPGHQDHSFEIVDGPADSKAPADAINPFIGVPSSDEPVHQPMDYDHFNGNTSEVLPAVGAARHDGTDSALDRDSLERDFDPLKNWGEPMGLPAPPPPADAVEKKSPAAKKDAAKKNPGAKADAKKPTATKSAAKKPATSTTTKTTKSASSAAKKDAVNGKPSKTKEADSTKTDNKKPPSSAGAKKVPATRPSSASAGKAEPKKAASGKRPATAAGTKSASAARAEHAPPVVPFYVDLTYVPYHGNQYYVDMNFFKRVRARYYVISALNPSPSVLNALLEAKQTWDTPDSEVTIIPTYDNDTLRHWMGLNHEQLAQLKVNVAPSAARCTIQLQDHETSCAAYRLEF